jgi:hypothetical protein
MYKCICKRCGHRLNRLFIVPEKVRERWMFVCPMCAHKSELAYFYALGTQVIRSRKCYQPMFVAAARGWSDSIGRLVACGQSVAGVKMSILAGEAIDKLRRRYGAWRVPHAQRRRDVSPHALLWRWSHTM